MISEKLLDQLNSQMNFEFFSSHVYLAKAAFCSSKGLDGFANFFLVQAEEERYHALKIYRYINTVGKRTIISGMVAPDNEYQSVLDAFEQAYAHEQAVTRRIYELSDTAVNEREYATIHFLKWFIDEQVEEEATFDSVLQKLKLISDGNGLFLLDTEFAKRTFTTPGD